MKSNPGKQQNELKATGILPEITESDKALGDLLERVAESNISHEKATEKKTNNEKEKTLEKKQDGDFSRLSQKHTREILKKIQVVAPVV